MNKFTLSTLVLCLASFNTAFAQFTNAQLAKMEAQYQKEADVVRMHHFDYYAQLLEEYKNKKGQYPFQYNRPKGTPFYVFIMTDEQEEKFNTRNALNIRDTKFFKELETVLGRSIDEKYDPQRVSTGCPTVYMYMVNGDEMYFAVHLNQPNSFTKINGPNCHKIELSNKDDIKHKFYSYNFLRNNLEYQKLIKTPITSRWFLKLEESNKRNSLK